MSSPFVPLATLAAPRSEASAAGARLKVVSKAAANEGFTPVIVAPPTASPIAGQTAPSHAADAAPTITLERDGDRVTRILVKCACGKVTQMDCVY